MMSPLVMVASGNSHTMPLVIYGLVCLASAISAMWIWPETKNLNLPDSLDRCEQVSSRRGKSCCVSSCPN